MSEKRGEPKEPKTPKTKKIWNAKRPETVKMRKSLNKNTKLPEVPKKPHLPTTSEN